MWQWQNQDRRYRPGGAPGDARRPFSQRQDLQPTTFVLSLAGVWIGHRFGSRLKSRATLAGGVILCLIGLKILLEHLGYLG